MLPNPSTIKSAKFYISLPISILPVKREPSDSCGFLFTILSRFVVSLLLKVTLERNGLKQNAIVHHINRKQKTKQKIIIIIMIHFGLFL